MNSYIYIRYMQCIYHGISIVEQLQGLKGLPNASVRNVTPQRNFTPVNDWPGLKRVLAFSATSWIRAHDKWGTSRFKGVRLVRTKKSKHK